MLKHNQENQYQIDRWLSGHSTKYFIKYIYKPRINLRSDTK